MNENFKYSLEQTINTAQGNGTIITAAVDKDGRKYLLQLSAGKSWQTEEELDKAVLGEATVKAGKSAAAKLAILAGLALLGLLFGSTAAFAQGVTTGYVSKSDLSRNLSWSEVVFPGDSLKSIRLLSLEVLLETATNELWIISGTRPITVQYSLNNTQMVVASNSFIPTNQYAILQAPGSNTAYLVRINHTNQLTNVFIGGLSDLPPFFQTNTVVPTNWTLWTCTNRFQSWPGAGRTHMDGPAIWAAAPRAPLGIRVGSAGSYVAANTNQIRGATVIYEPTP